MKGPIPTGSTLLMDIDPSSRDVIITHSLQDSITVTGQASGFNGEIKIYQDGASAGSGSGSGVPAQHVIHLTRNAQ